MRNVLARRARSNHVSQRSWRAAVRLTPALAVAATVALILGGSAVGAGSEHSAFAPVHFLTGPSSGQPLAIALDYLRAHKQELRLSGSDLANLAVTDQYTDSSTGTTHIYLQQRYKGIGVYNGITVVNIAKDGSVINVGNRFVPNLEAAVNSSTPVRDAARGVVDAAKALGLDLRQEPQVDHAMGGPAQKTVFDKSGISREPIPTELVYVPTPSGPRLAWNVTIDEASARHWWSANVDATTGDLLSKDDYVDYESYDVSAPPADSPLDGGRTLVGDPADAIASPFGWLDTDGASGADSTLTIGNNVHAATDVDGDNLPDPGGEADGGAGGLFDFPLDLTTQQPSDYRPAAVTNLFFWNNYLHDVSYRYGFTEAAGNFQESDYGRGGVGGDSVNADAQDGSGVNNANFGTPPDGSRPRMQMYLFTHPALQATLTVNAPTFLSGDYASGAGDFGRGSVTGAVARPGVATGCQASNFAGFPAGRIAVVDWTFACSFSTQIRNAQSAGATGVIVASIFVSVIGIGLDQDGTPNQPTIPAVVVSQNDGDLFKRSFAGLNVTVSVVQPLPRDGDLDNGVIAHEYTHGISNRLTGGPSTVSCLGNPEQEGEGWSDFMALVLAAKVGQTGATQRPIAAYANFGTGLRSFPYTTDTSLNPQTYNSIRESGEGHFVGAVWAEMLWEMYWNLVNEYGFDPNILDSYTQGGNNLALQLVMDGLKLQPCSPGFVDSRNAILLADQNLTGGANQCLIWRAFAKRGLGANANEGSPGSTTDGTQDFTVPATACGPRATPDPTSLSSTLLRGRSETKPLSVKNTGLVGAIGNLHWTISEAATDCSTPSDLGWVGESATSGTTSQGGSTPLGVTFDSAGLTSGQTYSGLLCLASDDAANPTVSVPLSLLVLADTTPPVISSTLSPAGPGSGGWYRTPVTLTWVVSDPESAVGSTTGCDNRTVSSEQALTEYSCSATSAGGTTGPARVVLGYDITSPTFTPSLAVGTVFALGATAPAVTLGGLTDPDPDAAGPIEPSGIASSSCGTIDTTAVGTKSVSCTATDNAGNTTTEMVTYVVQDPTPPVISSTLSPASPGRGAGTGRRSP